MRDFDDSMMPPKWTEEFTTRGEWWLPNSTKERVSGTLTFVPGEMATLRTKGVFPSLPIPELFKLGSRSLPVPLINRT
jgi:hypothetical protein